MTEACMVKFYHSIEPDLWQTVSASLQDFAKECQAGSFSNAESLVSRLRSVRRDRSALNALTSAIFLAKGAGIGEEAEICGPVFAFLAGIVQEMPGLFSKGLPLLAQNRTGQVNLSRRQCVALLAASLFNALPPTKIQCEPGQLDLPVFDLSYILEREETKSSCVLCYFVQLSRAPDRFLEEIVSFDRRCEELKAPEFWLSNDGELCDVCVVDGCIEDAEGHLQADFANEYLGGGAMFGGNVQEEIRFAVCPECFVGMLFCERMLPNEAILIIGPQQYSRYAGYGGRFSFVKPRNVLEERSGESDPHGRWGPHITALDALVRAGRSQYAEPQVLRELNKAYIACLGDLLGNSHGYGFATGNWGCGVFGGDPELKSLIQWLAASVAGRSKLLYYPFGDVRVAQLARVIEAVRAKCKTCADLYELIVYCAPGVIFEDILKHAKAECPLET
eukprot:TRINITY_DN75315_c0_g1_i1.p1 TRINITY_DN75315_c0_g1~~TRINITY_DN75315_c0_g1_i1.p1  ORF type:complete len:464 (+),score=55.96 TRINITY_DN75315_c0_g1_i1:50-1393(+)